MFPMHFRHMFDRLEQTMPLGKVAESQRSIHKQRDKPEKKSRGSYLYVSGGTDPSEQTMQQAFASSSSLFSRGDFKEISATKVLLGVCGDQWQ